MTSTRIGHLVTRIVRSFGTGLLALSFLSSIAAPAAAFAEAGSVTTGVASGITTSSATLNATNGPVAADGESFWVSTTPISISGPTIPAGVYSTPILLGVPANASFSDPLSIVTTNGIVSGGVSGNMPAISAGTTYYYVAWIEIGGTWIHGDVQTLTTLSGNHVPVAAAQSVSTNEDVPVAITLTATDADSGDVLTYATTSAPTHGVLTGTAPSLTYTPNASFTGADSFTFVASDGTATSSPATISIEVSGGGSGGGPGIPTCGTDDSTFDTFTTGSVNGQHGWSSTGSYDQAVVDNTYGFSTFGCKSLRISNAVTTGSFGDQTFAVPLSGSVGEADSTDGSFTEGTKVNHYEASFDIASADPSAQQPGLAISVSPDRGDGSRMSYLRFEDQSDGIHVLFDDVQTTTNPADWTETDLTPSGLDRSVPHHIKLTMDMNDGPSNDVVKVWIDGTLKITGTSWENYYRYDAEAHAEQSPRIVKTLLFRAAGTAVSATSGKGFLFDNVLLSSSENVPDLSALSFVNSPKYARINNAGDLDAQIVAPTTVAAVQFFVDGTTTPVAGSNIGGATATTDWWRLYTPLALGTHTITAKVEINSHWYDVPGSGTVYVLGNPTGSFVIPSSTNHLFRPGDNPLRVSADDANQSFRDVVFTIGATTYTVPRANCDLREAGNRVLCDVHSASNWSALPNGTYTASAKIENKVNNRTVITSESFTVSDSVPVVTNFQIVPTLAVYGTSITARADATDALGIKSLYFSITAPRAGDAVCDGNGVALASGTVTSGTGSTYTTTLDTTGLNGTYCVNVVAANLVNSHSHPQEIKVAIDTTPPTIPANGQPNGTILATNSFDFTWDASTDSSGPITYEYHASLNPAESGGVLTSGLWTSGVLTGPTIHSSGAGDGVWYWQVRAKDAAGNWSDWSPVWSVTLDTTAPTSTSDLTANQVVHGNVTFNQTVHDAHPASCKLRIFTANNSAMPYASAVVPVDGSDSCSFSIDTSNPSLGLSDGSYVAKFTAWDTAGNASILNVPFGIDNTPPAVPSLVSPSDDAHVNGASVTQSWSDTDPTVDHYVYASYNNAGATSLRWQQTVSATSKTATHVSDASYWWRVKAVDAVGNESAWSPLWKLTIDSTAPSTPALLSPADGSSLTTNTFDFTWAASTDTSSEPVTYEFQSSLNPAQSAGVLTTGIWSSGTLATALVHSSGASDGTWYWQVRAKDAAGNYSNWSAVRSVTLDTVPPAIASVVPFANSTVNGVTTFVVNATDVHPAGVSLELDQNTTKIADSATSGTEGTTESTLTYDTTTLADGTYTLKVVATDVAGNTTTQVYTYTVDNSGPIITLNGPAVDTEPWHGVYVEQGATATDALDGVVPVTTGGDTVNTSVSGTYYVIYTAHDSVGNTATTTRVVKVGSEPTSGTGSGSQSANTGAGQGFSGQVLGASVYHFAVDLTLGSTGADVTALQQLLLDEGYSIPSGVTGYFGTQTQAAVIAYQKAHGITPAAGYVGPLTRAELNKGTTPTLTQEQLQQQIDALTKQLQQLQAQLNALLGH